MHKSMTAHTDDEAACAEALLKLASSNSLQEKVHLSSVQTSSKKVSKQKSKVFSRTDSEPTKNVYKDNVEQKSRQSQTSSVLLDHSYSLPHYVEKYSHKVHPEYYTLLAAVESTDLLNRSPDDHHVIDLHNKSPDNHLVMDQSNDVPMNIFHEKSSDKMQNASIPTTSSKVKPCVKINCTAQSSEVLNQPTVGKNDSFRPRQNLMPVGHTDSSPDSDNSANMLHLKEKLLECPHCSRCFILSSMLQKHLAQSHNQGSPVTSKGQSSELQELLEEAKPEKVEKQDQQCQVCGVKVQDQDLVQHLMSEHFVVKQKLGKSEAQSQEKSSDKLLLVSNNLVETKVSNCLSMNTDQSDIVTCDICYAFVKKETLTEHVVSRHFSLVSGSSAGTELEIPPKTALTATPTVSLVASGLLNSTSCRDFIIQRYLTDAAITLSTSHFQENPYAQEVTPCYTDNESPKHSSSANLESSPPLCPGMATRRQSRNSDDSHTEEFFTRGLTVAQEEEKMKHTLSQHGYINLGDTQPIMVDNELQSSELLS